MSFAINIDLPIKDAIRETKGLKAQPRRKLACHSGDWSRLNLYVAAIDQLGSWNHSHSYPRNLFQLHPYIMLLAPSSRSSTSRSPFNDPDTRLSTMYYSPIFQGLAISAIAGLGNSCVVDNLIRTMSSYPYTASAFCTSYIQSTVTALKLIPTTTLTTIDATVTPKTTVLVTTTT